MEQPNKKKEESIEEAAKKIRWGTVKITKGAQTVLNQLRVLARGGKGLKLPPFRKIWPVITGAAIIGLAAWWVFTAGGGRNCIASAFDYPPTCNDDPQDEERTQFNRGGDGTCKRTAVNGKDMGKCLRVTSGNACVPC